MELVVIAIVLAAFGYFIYTQFKKAAAERAVPPVPGTHSGGPGETNPHEQEK